MTFAAVTAVRHTQAKMRTVGFLVDTHPQRERIINLLLAGVPSRKISKSVSPYIDHKAIWRYKRDKTDQELRNVITSVSSPVRDGETVVGNGTKCVTQASAAEVARMLLISRLADDYELIDKKKRQSKS